MNNVNLAVDTPEEAFELLEVMADQVEQSIGKRPFISSPLSGLKVLSMDPQIHLGYDIAAVWLAGPLTPKFTDVDTKQLIKDARISLEKYLTRISG